MSNGNGKVQKHVVGLLVEDKPGVLERLSGLFLRRGFNIDTIIVGKTAQAGISHIVISLFADDKTLEQLEKQVYKIIEVIKVTNLGATGVMREHCLIKINSTPENRNDIMSFVEMNKANVVEANHKSIIVELAAEPEKIDKFVEAIKPFGIKELSRTGINSLQRT